MAAIPSNITSVVELYNKYYTVFVGFASSYVGSRSLAEDIVSESMLAYLDNRDSLAPSSNIPAYIMRTVRNKCLNHIKQKGFRDDVLKKINHGSLWEKQMRISTLEACDPEELFSAELQAKLDEALKLLSKKTLEVFTLSRFENLTNREIAQRLGITVKGVEFHIGKALGILRKELKDYLVLLIFLRLLE
ncbi:MAG: RNA polymerase sigma-70 factor [Alistipes sp.]|nr:RNA polymerase sigma-70 factor [Alistipes sp.]